MRRCTPRAFTLIELLVVVAIIALLISILLPSMTAARDQGKKVKCASNEKQLGLGLTYYVHETGFYPSDHLQPPGGEWMISWIPRIRFYSDYQDDIFWCPATPSDFRWQPSQRDEYAGNLPAVEYGYRYGEKPISAPREEPFFFSYGHNGSALVLFTSKVLGLGMHTKDSIDGDNPGFSEIPERDVLRPSDMIAIADSRGDGASDTEISANRWRFLNYPGTRHFGGSLVLFADGHVVHMRLDNKLLCKLDGGAANRPPQQIDAEFDGAIVRRWTNDWKEHRTEWRRR